MHNFTEQEVAFIRATEAECKSYKSHPDRINPFDLTVMWSNIQNHIYSKFLRTEINSLALAIDHALYQIRSYLKEDKAQIRKAQNQRYNNKKKQQFIETNPELIAAKNKWQKAMTDRKAAFDQWNSYVDQLHEEYLHLKRNKV